jgi:hypothetical protein
LHNRPVFGHGDGAESFDVEGGRIMIGSLIMFLLGGLSVLATEFTVFDYVILQPIRDLMEPFARAFEQVFYSA